MKLKHCIGTLALCTLLLSTTGCMRLYETISIHDRTTATVTLKSCFSKEYMDSISAGAQTGSTQESTIETLEDGKEYYCSETSADGLVADISNSGDSVITPDIFVLPLNTTAESSVSTENATASIEGADELASAIANGIYVQLTIQLPDEIIDTNGTLSDSHTAVFATDQQLTDRWYAYTAAGKQQIEDDHTSPVINGVKQNKYYKAVPDITFSDDTGVIRVEVNGVAAKRSDSLDTVTTDGNTELTKAHDWQGVVNGTAQSLCKYGKNLFTTYDLNGNSSSVVFYLDNKAPVIKGVKKGKTYKNQAVLYVKDKEKLSKVTIDGKSQKLSKSKLVKKGSYKNFYKFKLTKAGKHKITASDAAGNKQTISFKITK